MTEPFPTALLLTTFGILLAASVLLGRWFERLGVPVVLLFLVLGMVAGTEGIGGIAFDDYEFAFRVGTMALVLILFDGGLNTPKSHLRGSVGPAATLATAGVGATAALVAIAARLAGLSWEHALLLGAVVSSTDAAAVFSVLRGSGLKLSRRVGSTLEVESGANDPMAVILTAAITAHIAGQATASWTLLFTIPLQLAIGFGVGLLLGFGGRRFLSRLHLTTGGLYPVITLSLAFLAFGLATIANGSGFLAVYVAAVVLGNGPIPYRNGLRRIHDAIAWLSQISMFLMLGLLVVPSQLVQEIPVGLGLGLFLAIVARPVAVVLCVMPFRFSGRETAYVSWVGLRGAVPIILATFPVLAGIDGASRVFHLVFFIVVVNAFVPGAFVRYATRLLGLERAEPPTPSAVLEINSTLNLSGELMSFYINDALAVCNARLSQIRFPTGAAAILVVRGQQLLAARGNTELRAGDHVYVFCRPEDRPYIELLFGRPQEGGTAPE